MRTSRLRTSSTHYHISWRCLYKIPSGAQRDYGGVDIDDTSDSEVRVWDIICLDMILHLQGVMTPKNFAINNHGRWALTGSHKKGTVVVTGQLASCLQMIAERDWLTDSVADDLNYSTKYIFKLVFFSFWKISLSLMTYIFVHIHIHQIHIHLDLINSWIALEVCRCRRKVAPGAYRNDLGAEFDETRETRDISEVRVQSRQDDKRQSAHISIGLKTNW